MGIVRMGPPEEIVLDLALRVGARVFVETGTFKGGTTRWAAGHFPVVHTIEKSETLFREQADALRALPGVTPHLGDSRTVLPSVLDSIGPQPAVFWLDGHWCFTPEGTTAGAQDQCPLLDELAAIQDRTVPDIVLIDDARYFLSVPPLPNDALQWPTLADLCLAVSKAGGDRRRIQVFDDVIFILPATPNVLDAFATHTWRVFDAAWADFGKARRGEFRRPPRPSFARRVLGRLGWR